MPTAEFTDPRLNGYSSAERGIDHVANSWVPPTAPTEPSTDDDTFLGEQAFGATPWDEDRFQPAEQSDIDQILMGFGPLRKLIIGTAIVAALAVGVLGYFFWPAAGEKKAMETAEATPAVQSATVAPVQAAPRTPEPSLSGATAVAWPDLPPSGIVGGSPQIPAAAPAGNTQTPQTPAPAGNTQTRQPASQNTDIVFLQRPGVNIRSTPAANGPVLGTASKGTRFKAAKRDGDWVQVESDRLKGWINSQFLGPNAPRQ